MGKEEGIDSNFKQSQFHSDKIYKTPKSSILDENRNKRGYFKHTNENQHKNTRFSSLDRFDSNDSPPTPSPRSVRGRSPADTRPFKRQPAWLTRKSADWGTSGDGKCSGVIGNRRTEVMIVLLGSTRTGKSAIVNQFLHNIFCEEYSPTVDELHWIEYDTTTYSNTMEENCKQNETTEILLLKIMDSSPEFIGMRKLYEQQGDAFILVISVDDPNSFDEAKIIRQEIAERNTKKAPIICVLSKIDSKSRLVNPDEVREYAQSNQCLFVQVSAKEDHDSVAEIFKRLLQQNSVVPCQAELRYRRKSMPIMISSDFGNDPSAIDGQKSSKKHSKLISMNKKCLKAIDEPNGIRTAIVDDEKQSSCAIC